MNDTVKQILEDIYKQHCFIMTDHGKIIPMVFIIKDSEAFPVFVSDDKMGIGQYISCALDIAKEHKAEGLVMVCEQYAVKESDKIQDLIGEIPKAIDSKHIKEHLVLSYIEADGTSHMLMGEIKKDDGGVRFVKNQEWTNSSHNNFITSLTGDEPKQLN